MEGGGRETFIPLIYLFFVLAPNWVIVLAGGLQLQTAFSLFLIIFMEGENFLLNEGSQQPVIWKKS